MLDVTDDDGEEELNEVGEDVEGDEEITLLVGTALLLLLPKDSLATELEGPKEEDDSVALSKGEELPPVVLPKGVELSPVLVLTWLNPVVEEGGSGLELLLLLKPSKPCPYALAISVSKIVVETMLLKGKE